MTKDYRGFSTGLDYYNAHPELHPLIRTQLTKADSGLAQKLKKEGKWEIIPKGKMGPPKGQRYRRRWGTNREYATEYDYYMAHMELHHLAPHQLKKADKTLHNSLRAHGFFKELFPHRISALFPEDIYRPTIDTFISHESRQEGRIFGYADLHMAAYYIMKEISEHGEPGKIPEQEKKSSGGEVRQRENATPDLRRLIERFGFNGDDQKTLFIGGLRLDYRHDQYFVDSLLIQTNRSDNPPLDSVYRIDISGSHRVRLLKLFKDGSQVANANFELSSPRRTIRVAPDVKMEMKEIGDGQHLLSIVQGQIPDDFIDLVKRIDSSLIGTYIALGGVPFTERQFTNWMFSGGE
ncbi:hypothetical protein HYX04_04260 [Candidatus Woesearchaeota archaeon]|nr:hypothetical protein [Candidatus Woesearchaeota archaeon]